MIPALGAVFHLEEGNAGVVGSGEDHVLEVTRKHVLPNQFRDVVLSAARDAHVSLFQAEYRTQGRDHPILPAAPETQYLKCGIFRVDKA